VSVAGQTVAEEVSADAKEANCVPTSEPVCLFDALFLGSIATQFRASLFVCGEKSMSDLHGDTLEARAPSAVEEMISSRAEGEASRDVAEIGPKTYRLRSIATECLRSGMLGVRADSGTDDISMPELADSVRAQGVIEPIVVRKAAGGFFEVVVGERRLMAAKLANLPEIPCVVTECSDSEAVLLSLTENLQRSDLNPIQKARGLRRLLDDFQLSQWDIGRRIGMSQSAIAHYLRLLTLPVQVQDLIGRGVLSMGHGKLLASGGNDAQVLNLARECVAGKKSVRELESSLSSMRAETDPRRERESPRKRRDERDLPNGVFLVIKENSRDTSCGTIEIPYYSEEEKEWVLVALGSAGGAARRAQAARAAGERNDGSAKESDTWGYDRSR
jgi:ParB family transcriptional regulator, chromosome partitioning protein